MGDAKMNMYMRLGAAMVAASMAGASVCAQTTAPTIVPSVAVAPVVAVPMVVSTASRTVLPQGTSIRLRTLSELTSQTAKTGQRFDLEVAEDVMLGGRVVIPRGSPAVGDIAMVKKKGMWGKSGKLEARVLYIRANGRDIPVRGSVGDKGETGTAGVVGAIVVLPIAGFFVTGTSAVLPAGTGANAALESDLEVAFEGASVSVAPSGIK
jgi:hypothetical protein